MTITVDFGQLHPATHATWAVVGGQMVAIHATVWGVELPRATDDGDIVVDVHTFTREPCGTSPMRSSPTASTPNSRRRESSDS